MRTVRALAATVLAFAALTSPAAAQMLAEPFAATYTLSDIGSPPGVPTDLGGLTLKAGTTDRLLIGGKANDALGALYEIGVIRDAQGHITGFNGDATRYSDAAYNDGGVIYGPDNVLLLTRWPQNELGMTKPGSTLTDKIFPLDPLGVAGSVASVGFVPSGMGGAGSFKLVSYDTGQWYTADLEPDGDGTFNVLNVLAIGESTLPTGRGAEGFAFVAKGAPEFTADSLLLSEYDANAVAAYALDAGGNPIVSSRRAFITGLLGAEGAFIDPVTGDFLFSTFGAGNTADNTVIVVRRSVPPALVPAPTPTPTLPPEMTPTPVAPPVTGVRLKSQVTAGQVLVRVPGARDFAPLAGAASVPVGAVVDARKGSVTFTAATSAKATESARVSAGIFAIRQARKAGSIPEFVVATAAGLARACAPGRTPPRKGVVRTLSVVAQGTFRTVPKKGIVTGRNASWTTTDRCNGTLTTVAHGSVTVRHGRRTLRVRAGHSYLIRARLFAARKARAPH